MSAHANLAPIGPQNTTPVAHLVEGQGISVDGRLIRLALVDAIFNRAAELASEGVPAKEISQVLTREFPLLDERTIDWCVAWRGDLYRRQFLALIQAADDARQNSREVLADAWSDLRESGRRRNGFGKPVQRERRGAVAAEACA